LGLRFLRRGSIRLGRSGTISHLHVVGRHARVGVLHGIEQGESLRLLPDGLHHAARVRRAFESVVVQELQAPPMNRVAAATIKERSTWQPCVCPRTSACLLACSRVSRSQTSPPSASRSAWTPSGGPAPEVPPTPSAAPPYPARPTRVVHPGADGLCSVEYSQLRRRVA